MNTKKVLVDMDKQVDIRFPKDDENLFQFMKRFERTALRKGWTQEEVYAVIDRSFWYSYHYTLDTILNHCLFPESDIDKL